MQTELYKWAALPARRLGNIKECISDKWLLIIPVTTGCQLLIAAAAFVYQLKKSNDIHDVLDLHYQGYCEHARS